jgi:hypothetical protein
MIHPECSFITVDTKIDENGHCYSLVGFYDNNGAEAELLYELKTTNLEILSPVYLGRYTHENIMGFSWGGAPMYVVQDEYATRTIYIADNMEIIEQTQKKYSYYCCEYCGE